MKTHDDRTHYRAISKQLIANIEMRFGKGWRSCFSQDVQRELCASQAFGLMLTCVDDDMPAARLEKHGRLAYNEMLSMLNLEE